MLHINPQSLAEITAHAAASADECCGFILGRDASEIRAITNTLAVANSAAGDKKVYFEIAPTDYMRAERQAEQAQLRLLGTYHSHLEQTALPSEYDQLMALPTFSYVIVSVRNRTVADIRAWRLDAHGVFEEEPLTFSTSLCPS